MPEVHRENQQNDEKGSTTSDTTARDIALCDLRKNDYNPRTTFDDEAMDELQESIDRHGLISSLLVRPLEEGDVYEVVAGERRLRALRKIHGSDSETEIPCLIDEITDCEARVSAFVENHERVDLTPIEEAKFLGEMATVTYTTDSELGDKERTFAEYIPIAKDADCSIQLPSNSHSEVKRLTDQIGLEATSIRKRLALLALPDAGQIAVDTGTIGLEAAYRIVSGLSELSAAEARREHMLGLIDGAKSGEMAIGRSKSALRRSSRDTSANRRKRQIRSKQLKPS